MVTNTSDPALLEVCKKAAIDFDGIWM